MKNSTNDNRSASCPSALHGELKAYLDGELNGLRHLVVHRHVNRCQACQNEAAALAKISAQLRATSQVLPPAYLAHRILNSQPRAEASQPVLRPRVPKTALGGGLVALTAVGALAAVLTARLQNRVPSLPHTFAAPSRSVMARSGASNLGTARRGATGAGSAVPPKLAIIPPDPTSAEADRLTREFFQSQEGRTLLAANSVSPHATPAQAPSPAMQMGMVLPADNSGMKVLKQFVHGLGGHVLPPAPGAASHGTTIVTLKLPTSRLQLLIRGLSRMNAGLMPTAVENLPANTAARRKVSRPVMLPSSHAVPYPVDRQFDGTGTSAFNSTFAPKSTVVVRLIFPVKK